CSDNRYVVSGAPLVIGGAPLIQFVGIAGNSLTLGACAGGLKLKATKTGTKLTGKVGTCLGVSGPLKVTGLIDPTCGSMAATATGADGTVYTLTIPPNALLVETAISMTPIVSISGGNLPSDSVLGVDLQPSGLRLYEFADLSIVPPQLSPTADIAGFTYEGDGDDLHRYPAALDAGRIL